MTDEIDTHIERLRDVGNSLAAEWNELRDKVRAAVTAASDAAQVAERAQNNIARVTRILDAVRVAVLADDLERLRAILRDARTSDST